MFESSFRLLLRILKWLNAFQVLKMFSFFLRFTMQKVFTSPQIDEQLQIQERKPPVVSRQCVVYQFNCDLCDTDYIGYTTRHLHHRTEEHRATAAGAHVKGCHGISNPELLKQFTVLKKCQGKLDCLIREMLFIRERESKLNTQSDSIRAKVFV